MQYLAASWRVKNIPFLFQTYILVIICVALGFVDMRRKAWVEKGAQICVTEAENKTW